ncbi:MAG: DUF4838 domain-containing protein [Clostridia bacterium]|nr:DUF4838 domain-containing protein [Clostridia bacterium]
MRKILSMVLALSMMLTVIAACNNEPVEPVENPEDQQQEENQENEGEEMVSDVLNLVVDGVSDYVIVRGENAYISEVTASTELQKYLKQISGVEIPIITDSTAPVEKEIVVGKTNREADGEFNRDELGDDGLVIKSNGKKLFLVGGEQRGTLYAVYEFLEAYLGCRFYTNTIEKIPELKTISIEQIAEDKQIPKIQFRDLGWGDYSWHENIVVKRKLNTSFWCTAVSEEKGLTYRMGLAGHTSEYLMPPTEFFAEHPEYYAMNAKGERVGGTSETAAGNNSQLCMSNPDVIRIITERVRQCIKDNPHAQVFQIGQNDNQNYCHCDECMKIYEEEGGALSGTLIRLVNAVANDIAEDYPDVYIMTYAYQYTRSAPVTPPADNVLIFLCSIESCYSHPIYKDCVASKNATYADGSNNTFAEDLIGWGKICNNIWIYDYTTNYGNWAMTFPNFHVLRDNIQFYVDNGTSGVIPQGNHRSTSVEFSELRCYLISKLLWNPYMSEEEFFAHMDDFLTGVYGEGGKFIREYIELAEKLSEPHCFGIFSDANETYDWPEVVEKNPKDSYPEAITVDMIKNYETVDWTQYWNWYKDYESEPEIISEGEKLFKAAMELAKTDSEKRELDRAYSQIEYLRLCYDYEHLKIGSGSIGKIAGYFMADHPEEFTTEDTINYRRNIVKLSNTQRYGIYEDSCRAFIEKVKSYGVTEVREAKALNIDNMDLTQYPTDWYLD